MVMVKKKRKDASNRFKWKQSAGEVILWLVRWHGRFTLSNNDLKEMPAERGLFVDKTIIYR
jgi:IS6 family transposase